jgi:hypothetical protein
MLSNCVVGGDAGILLAMGWMGQEGLNDERYQRDGDLLDHAGHADNPLLRI